MDILDEILQKNTRQAGKVIQVHIDYSLTRFVVNVLSLQFSGQSITARFESGDEVICDRVVPIIMILERLIHFEFDLPELRCVQVDPYQLNVFEGDDHLICF